MRTNFQNQVTPCNNENVKHQKRMTKYGNPVRSALISAARNVSHISFRWKTTMYLIGTLFTRLVIILFLTFGHPYSSSALLVYLLSKHTAQYYWKLFQGSASHSAFIILLYLWAKSWLACSSNLNQTENMREQVNQSTNEMGRIWPRIKTRVLHKVCIYYVSMSREQP